MADKILILILCSSATVVLSQDFPVTVNGNCTPPYLPEPFDVWGVERDPLICRQWNTGSCDNGVLPPQVGGTFMGAPESLSIEAVLIPDPNGGLSPQMIVTWTPPRSAAGFDNLKGFNMEIHKLTGTAGKDFICRVFDFSESNFTGEDYKLTFRKKFVQFAGGPSYLYRLDLYTLPRSHQSIAKKKFFTLQSPIVPNDTANWSAAISYDVENVSAPATITVQFSVAPAHYGFNSYYIQLIDKGPVEKKNAVVSCYVDVHRSYTCQGHSFPQPADGALTITHSFYDIGAGRYAVWVQAFDPHWQDHNCLCFHGYHEVNNVTKRDCDRCITSSTGNFDVDGEIPSPSPSTSTPTSTSTSPSPSTSTSEGPNAQEVKGEGDKESQNAVVTTVAAVLGVLLGLFLVGIVIIFVIRQRKFSGNRPILGLNNNKPLLPSTLPKKTVYLLYTCDHKEHVNVVTKFAIYLTNRCNCQVFFMPWFRGEIQNMGCYEWVISHIDKSDYVIIISSEAAFNLFEARNTNTSFQIEDQGPEIDVFSTAMTHVMSKLGNQDFYKKTILAYFEYTSEEFVLKDINPGIQYKLPKHLKELMCHIHEVNMYTVDPRKLEVESMDNLANNEGHDLQEAITKAKHFEKSNREWFREKFHRQDSAYDSVSSPDLENDQDLGDSVSFSPNVFTGPPPYFSHDGNDMDEARSCATYNTQYVNAHPEQRSIIPPSIVATTTAHTEDIDARLHQVNMENMQNPMYMNQVPFSGYHNAAYNDLSPSETAEFYPPNDPLEVDDIDKEFITINMNCYEQDKLGTSPREQKKLNTQFSVPQTAKDNNLDEEDLVDGRDV